MHDSASLWQQRRFRLLWAGHTISAFGSQITPVALSVIATLTLQATPTQMAFLILLNYVPAVLFGMFAGVWVDRARKRRVMIISDLLRAAVLLAVPFAAGAGLLGMDLLYAITLLLAVGGVLFGVANVSFVPAIVTRRDLLSANSALSSSSAVARIAGPGLAGLLIQWLSAQLALLVDALSFVVSALALLGIHTQEAVAAPHEQRPPFFSALWEGLLVLVHQPYLRTIVLMAWSFDLGWNMLYAVYTLYVIRVLGLSPAAYGLIFSIGTLGALTASLLAGSITRRVGIGSTLLVAQVVMGAAALLIPAAQQLTPLALGLLILAELILSAASTLSGITAGSLIQATIPVQLLGRVQASRQALGLLPAVIGTALGGLIGSVWGIAPTVLLGACLGSVSFVWLLVSPLRRVQQLPDSVA